MSSTKEKISIAINARYKVHPVTGVQRYAHEIVNRMTFKNSASSEAVFEPITPNSAKGVAGHLWEQTILPARARGRLLWNPSCSGPVFYPRQIVTFHDLFPLEHPEWYGRAYGEWYKRMMPRLARRAIHIIAVSAYTKSRIISMLGCTPEKISVIQNGVSTNFSRANGGSIDAARSALSIPTSRYILTLSSLEKRKNLAAVFSAWESIQSRLPKDVWLVVAGPRPDPDVYGRQQINPDLPRVHITGYVPEEHLAGLYSGASLFVFPSLAEGFGLPLLEAMACGVRTIAADNTSLPEVGGKFPVYINPVPQEIGMSIEKLLGESASWNAPAEVAMKHAQSFSWDRAATETENLLISLALKESVNKALEITAL